MKRASYFISARSYSADILASELVLAMSDQFPKIECFGIFGEWTGRTRSVRLEDLKHCLDLGLHENGGLKAEASALVQNLLVELEKSLPQLAILVGYSPFHHQLAGFFKQHSIPVVLYDITPEGATQGINAQEAGQRINCALGVTPKGSEWVRAAGMPYYFIGSPHKDRVDRVIVDAASFGFDPNKPILSIFPGGKAESYSSTFPVFIALAEKLSEDPRLQVLLSLPENLLDEPSLKVKGQSLRDLAERKKPSPSLSLRVMTGMPLEILSLSRLAITGVGAITVECSLFQVPLLPIYAGNAKLAGQKSLINQILGRPIVAEYACDTPLEQLQKIAQDLLIASPQRENMVKALAELKQSLQGFAAENAADYIGSEIGQWKPGKRANPPKANKAAS